MNTQVNVGDTLFATVKRSGITIARHTLSGYSSIADVLSSLCGKLRESNPGLVTIELRNRNMGWISSRSILLRAC